MSYASLIVAPRDVLAGSSAPLAEVAVRLFGRVGRLIVVAGGLVSMAGCLHVTVLETGQTAMAAARDGLFPRPFARLSSRGTPAVAHALAGGFAAVLVLLNHTKDWSGPSRSSDSFRR